MPISVTHHKPEAERMECYISTITLQNERGMFATFVSISASTNSDNAVADAYRNARQQNPGWQPVAGTAAPVDHDKFKELANRVLGE